MSLLTKQVQSDLREAVLSAAGQAMSEGALPLVPTELKL